MYFNGILRAFLLLPCLPIRVNNPVNVLAPELFFFNFSTPCIQNVNNTGTKYVKIMKQTAF
jgi:hypothetical protein